MNLTHILHSEAGLTLVGALFTAVWTFFRSRSWFQQAKRSRYRRALQAVEAAVEETYRGYVRDIKHAREDGRLTDVEIRRARNRARERAISLARRDGADLFTELGEDFIDYWITRSVNKLKRRP